VCEITQNNIAGPNRPQMAIQRMPIECWIPKAIDTHREYIVLIAFALATVVA
jgi:hypothetical protein